MNITSLTNKVWNIQNGVAGANIVKILAENRNIRDIDAFLNTSIKRSLPDPFVFLDMEKAVNRIVDAIRNRQRIAILGDYDVDGVSSVSIFVKFLEHIGADYAYSIPDRMGDGYGLSISNIEKHKKCLIIAVDCGSNSLEELKYAKTNDIDVIVIDHHRMSVISEDAIIINPHRPDEKEDYRYLCASGLVFICIVGVNRLLREMKFYSSELVEPDLMDYTDLTALATVCDVVSLVGLNRAFVSTGMKVIRQRKNFGIDALLSDHRGTCINSETISFFLGPKLNASGRMASSDLSVRLLTTKNPIEARKIAQQLDDLNKKRQNLELEIMEEAVSSLEERQGNFICLYNADWHVGIIGIIAGRLREKYNKPSIIISRDANGIGKASCRSIEDVDISDVIRKGVEQGIIISGGGHSMAAGFLIDISKIDDLMGFLSSNIKYNCIPQKLCADCLLPLDMISLDLLDSISILEPFGMGNQQPRFVIPDVNVVSSRIVGNNHVGFTILDEKGNSLRAISFRSVGTELGDILLKEEVCSASLLGTLILSSWGGQNYVNFRLEDISSHSFGVNKNE